MPGLLEGAHAGVGLGHQFLRHCQRCRLLVHVVDGTSPDPMGDYRAIRQELELFNPQLAEKPQVIQFEWWGLCVNWQQNKQAANSHAGMREAIACPACQIEMKAVITMHVHANPPTCRYTTHRIVPAFEYAASLY